MPMSQEIEAKVLEGLLTGDSLNSVCMALGINESTVRTQAGLDAEFHAKYTRAREIGYHARADRLAALVDSATAEDVAVLRLKLDHEKWSLSKMLPKVYGDKTTTTHEGELTVTNLSAADALALAEKRSKERTNGTA